MTTAKPYRIRTAADVLSYIPHALGFLPRQSAVFVTMSGQSLGATLRVDLPPDPTAAEAHEFTQQVQHYLLADSAADRTLIVLYSDCPWEDPEAPPHGRIMDALYIGLAASGLPVRNAWFVSESIWREYSCVDLNCCPWPGRPVAEISTSELNAEMIFRGSHYGRSIEEATGVGPQLRFGINPAVEESTRDNERRLGRSWLLADQFAATLNAWRTAMEHSEDRSHLAGRLPSAVRDEESAGFLLASLSCRTVRDFLLVQISVGPAAALAGAVTSDSLSMPGGSPLMPPSLSSRCGTIPFRTGRLRRSADMPELFRDVLVGDHDGAPDWKTIDRAADLFQGLLQFSSGTSTAALLSMLAWIEWAKGRGSRAQCFVDKCLEVDPDYKLARLLGQLFERGLLPQWAKSPHTAWRNSASVAA